MASDSKRLHLLYIVSVTAMILGAIDPLEGSIPILFGSLLLSYVTYKRRARRWKIFFTASLLIVFGTTWMFLFSYLGGIGVGSSLSLWYGLLILPYPIGWILSITLLITNVLRQRPKIS